MCPTDGKFNHAVFLVGFGSELSNTGVLTDYWIIQNSWGKGIKVLSYTNHSLYAQELFYSIKRLGRKWLLQNETSPWFMQRGKRLLLILKMKFKNEFVIIKWTDAMFPVVKTAAPKALKPIYEPTDCQIMQNVYSLTGDYIKSFCIDFYWRKYEASRINCLQRGMQLYKLDSSEATAAVLDAANKEWYAELLVNDLHVHESTVDQVVINGISDNNPFQPYRVTMNSDDENQSVCEYINIDRKSRQAHLKHEKSWFYSDF
jgi:hypothetical protein